MSTTLLISQPGARNKREALFREIVSLCPGKDFSSLHYICPNSFVIHEAELAFHQFVQRPAYIPFQSMTLRSLAQRLYTQTFMHDPVSERLRPLVLCEILGQGGIGYARIISDLYKKLKHYMPDKDLFKVKQEIASLVFEERTARRASDAVDSLIAYEQTLQEKGLSDVEGMMTAAVTLISDHFSSEILVFEGFYDPTPLEMKIIRALMYASRITVILAEDQSGIAHAFQHDGTDVTRKRLTALHARTAAGYVTYASREDEAEGIARSVKGLILDGTHPRNIVVTFPVMEKYLPILRRVFRKHGVPLNTAERDFFTSKPLLAIADLITSLEDDYPAVEFLSFITSPSCVSLPSILKECAVTFSYRAGIVKGRLSWLSLKETIRNSPTETGSKSETELLESFQKELTALMTITEDIKAQPNLIAFIDALEQALEQFGLFQGLIETEGREEGTRLGDRVKDVFAELKTFAVSFGLDRKTPARPGFYIRNMLRDITVFESRGDGVCAAPLEAAAGLETRAVFLGGATEEDLPLKPPIDPLLPERAKKSLGLPCLEDYLQRQKRNFRRILNASAVDPRISCPAGDGDKLFIPSPYLDWESGSAGLSPNIFSEEDLMIMEAAAHPAGRRSRGHRGDARFGQEEPGARINQSKAVIQEYISITHIDAYRKCPRRFYIERVLGLEIEEPAKFEVEARIWGTLAHRVMERLFADGDMDLRLLEKKVYESLRVFLTQYALGDFWSRVAEEIFQRLVPSIVEEERKIRAEGFAPHAVEERIRADIMGLKLRGKIDRVDMKRQGSGKIKGGKQTKDNVSTVQVIDYKTGAPDKDSLQLPLYAAMWEKVHGQGVERLGMYSLRDGRITWYPKRKAMDEVVKEKLEFAVRLVDRMKRGLYPPEPHTAQECRYCYHGPTCEGSQ